MGSPNDVGVGAVPVQSGHATACLPTMHLSPVGAVYVAGLPRQPLHDARQTLRARGFDMTTILGAAIRCRLSRGYLRRHVRAECGKVNEKKQRV